MGKIFENLNRVLVDRARRWRSPDAVFPDCGYRPATVL